MTALAAQIATVAQRLSEDRRDYEMMFVRRDVYDARHATIRRDVDDLRKDAEEREKADAETRRQFLFMILGAVLTAVLSLVVAVIIASGGAP